MKVKYQEIHLLESIKQRSALSEAQARTALLELKKAIRRSLPNEWRFTRHPSGFFLLCDIGAGVKYFGMSYRASPYDDQFRKEIDFVLENADGRMKSFQWDESIAKLKDKYLEIVQYPDSEVCHEIKTVYEPEWGIHDVQAGYEELKKNAGRPIAVRIEREAIRPNAILLDGELWARQDVWIHLNKLGTEFLLFERLTMQGLDKACIKVFEYRPSGVLEPRKGVRLSLRPVFLPRRKPPGEYEGYHTESYWSLPTAIEKDYLDLMFKQRKSRRDDSVVFDSKDSKAVSFIRRIVES